MQWELANWELANKEVETSGEQTRPICRSNATSVTYCAVGLVSIGERRAHLRPNKSCQPQPSPTLITVMRSRHLVAGLCKTRRKRVRSLCWTLANWSSGSSFRLFLIGAFCHCLRSENVHPFWLPCEARFRRKLYP